MKIFHLAFAISIGFSSMGFANCRQVQSGQTTEFRCPDGSIKKIFVSGGSLVVQSYSPEAKRWSEDRYPYSGDSTLRGVDVSVMFGNLPQGN